MAELKGWGVTQNVTSAFNHLNKAASANDPFGVYFLQQCYQYGWGTYIDMKMAGHLNNWITFQPAGQALSRFIGSDDAETAREVARMQLMLDPPRRRNCERMRSGELRNCVPGDIDRDELDRQLGELDQLVSKRRTANRVRRQVPTVASGCSSHQALATS